MVAKARSRVVIAALALVAFVLVCAVFWTRGGRVWPRGRARITVSRETTYLIEPLTPDGYVDYVAAINQLASAGVTPENNAAVPIVQAFGPGEIPAEKREEFFRLLSIPPLAEKGDYFVDLSAFEERLPAADAAPGMDQNGQEQRPTFSDQHAQAMTRPWSREEFPAVAQWLDMNERHFPAIIVASKRPRCYGPLATSANPPTVFAALNSSCQPFREAAWALGARAMFRLREGRVKEAWEDLAASHRLGRLVAQGPMTVDTLVGIAVEGMACNGDIAMARYGRLTSKEAMAQIAELRALKPWPKLADKMNAAERFQMLDTIRYLAQDGGLDWDRVLRVTNYGIDCFVGALRKPTRAERVAALAAINKELIDAARAPSLAEILVAFFSRRSPRSVFTDKTAVICLALHASGIELTVLAEARTEARFQLTLAALALAAYWADHGAYPQQLSGISPQYLPDVPADPCGDGPFHYRVASGEYTLYSVGDNGKDDGGRCHNDPEDKDAGSDQDDIVIRSAVLWKSP